MWNSIVETFWKTVPGSPVITNTASDPVAYANQIEADKNRARVDAQSRGTAHVPAAEEQPPMQSSVVVGGGRKSRGNRRKSSSDAAPTSKPARKRRGRGARGARRRSSKSRRNAPVNSDASTLSSRIKTSASSSSASSSSASSSSASSSIDRVARTATKTQKKTVGVGAATRRQMRDGRDLKWWMRVRAT